MGFRELTMIDVKEVLRRWSAGQSDRRIGREAGADRKTVVPVHGGGGVAGVGARTRAIG